ncbi:hypothetical protein [Hydrogenimonas sp. SS33]|uniref:hypothetical protein n=1 Tax=Hydrogenimonas leucolamina TaxID=2954236 RepID=UPI00336BC5D2
MATPMEYDVLREIYSSERASLSRLRVKYGIDTKQFEAAKNKFVQVWINEVQGLDLKDIDYQAAAKKLKDAAKPWTDLEEKM